MGAKWTAVQSGNTVTWEIWKACDARPFATGMSEENATRLASFLNAVWDWCD